MPAPVSVRERAARDIEAIVAHLDREGRPGTADRFIDALETAVGHIARHPLSGSPQLAFELDIPTIRTWRVRKFPYLIIYAAADDRLEVWRVLHSHRDVPAEMGLVDPWDPGLL